MKAARNVYARSTKIWPHQNVSQRGLCQANAILRDTAKLSTAGITGSSIESNQETHDEDN
jgi:hypothetical protein